MAKSGIRSTLIAADVHCASGMQLYMMLTRKGCAFISGFTLNIFICCTPLNILMYYSQKEET